MEDTVLLNSRSAESILRVIEATPQVRRRFQFFVWMQNQMQSLIPHEIAICGTYLRARREVVFEVFQNIVIAPPTLELLTDGGSELMRAVVTRWIDTQGQSTTIDIAALPAADQVDWRMRMAGEGISQLLVHGVSRPQRPTEIESLFVFADRQREFTSEQRLHLELLLPHLHSTFLRVQATEREMNIVPTVSALNRERAVPPMQITQRERQILGWVREGKSNQEIADVLGISPLTVKNHVQKILRKLGANNRAQAVALAMTLNLLTRGAPEAAASLPRS